VEGTCNAQAADDRNWVEIQVLERRLQTVRPEGARFALHVLFAFAAFYSLIPYVLSPVRPAWSAMVRGPTSFAGSAFHSLLFPKSTYSSQLTSPSLLFYEDQLDQCRGEPAQLAENKTLAPVRIVRSNADHGGPPRPRQVLAREAFFTTRGRRDVSIFVLSAPYPCRSTSGRRYL
jgi:hypothetical protein